MTFMEWMARQWDESWVLSLFVIWYIGWWFFPEPVGPDGPQYDHYRDEGEDCVRRTDRPWWYEGITLIHVFLSMLIVPALCFWIFFLCFNALLEWLLN